MSNGWVRVTDAISEYCKAVIDAGWRDDDMVESDICYCGTPLGEHGDDHDIVLMMRPRGVNE